LIRHAFCVTVATIPLLPVAMIQPPLGALLMTAIGGAMLTYRSGRNPVVIVILIRQLRSQRDSLAIDARTRW
jgi:hypothetical protein